MMCLTPDFFASFTKLDASSTALGESIQGEKKLDKNKEIYPSFLTKSELDWLLGNNISISKTYQYKMKSSIKRKWHTFLNLELPLLQKSGIISDNLTVFGKGLTVFGKVDDTLNSLKTENCGQNMVGRKGLTLFT